MQDQDEVYMREALNLAQQGIELGHGGPFGAVVVLKGKILGRGWNQVVHLNDPTAHAEMQAIRQACRMLHSYHLPEAILYTTCQPCPMCLSAAYWAHIARLVYAAERKDAANIGFNDQTIASELARPPQQREMPARQLLRKESLNLFEQWLARADRVDY
jgi:tRNA(Arg) A34 adenosine deaminase TadA